MSRGVAAVLGLSACVVMLAIAGFTFRISTGQDDPHDLAEQFGHPRGGAVGWEPDALTGTGLELAIARRSDGKPEILYQGPGSAGGRGFVSGWAVESESLPTSTGEAIVGIAIAEAVTVRFGKARDALRVPTTPMPGDPTKRVFALHVPAGGLAHVHANDIVAFDAQGRLLGRQHYNDGRGGFGAYDGVYDRNTR